MSSRDHFYVLAAGGDPTSAALGSNRGRGRDCHPHRREPQKHKTLEVLVLGYCDGIDAEGGKALAAGLKEGAAAMTELDVRSRGGEERAEGGSRGSCRF